MLARYIIIGELSSTLEKVTIDESTIGAIPLPVVPHKAVAEVSKIG